MKKLIKFLIVLICILVFINITLSRYIAENSDMSRLVGNEYSGGKISTVNYARISRNFNYYLEFLKSGDYETAYKMLFYNYRSYKDYDAFYQECQSVNYSNYDIENISNKTENIYSIVIGNGEEKIEFLMLFNEENTSYYIIPENFLEYKILNSDIKKKKVKYEVIETINYIDKFLVNIQITNMDSEEIVNISDIDVTKGSGKVIKSNVKFPLVIGPDETRNLVIEFETDIDFPTKINIFRKIEKKDKIETYTIDI